MLLGIGLVDIQHAAIGGHEHHGRGRAVEDLAPEGMLLLELGLLLAHQVQVLMESGLQRAPLIIPPGQRDERGEHLDAALWSGDDQLGAAGDAVCHHAAHLGQRLLHGLPEKLPVVEIGRQQNMDRHAGHGTKGLVDVVIAAIHIIDRNADGGLFEKHAPVGPLGFPFLEQLFLPCEHLLDEQIAVPEKTLRGLVGPGHILHPHHGLEKEGGRHAMAGMVHRHVPRCSMHRGLLGAGIEPGGKQPVDALQDGLHAGVAGHLVGLTTQHPGQQRGLFRIVDNAVAHFPGQQGRQGCHRGLHGLAVLKRSAGIISMPRCDSPSQRRAVRQRTNDTGGNAMSAAWEPWCT